MKAHNLLVTGSLTAGSGEVISSISSSVAATTLGLGNRVTTLEGRSATTGSNTFQGLQTINGNLVVTGSLTAQQFIVSSSVTYLTTSFASGSTKFGDSIDDTMQITGSVYITGAVVTMYASLTSTGSDARIYSFSNDAAGSYAGFTAQSTAANGGFHLLSPVSGAMSHVNTVSNYDTYLSTRNANNLILATANTERIRIGGSGGVAVTGSLNVNGNTYVTGSVTAQGGIFNINTTVAGGFKVTGVAATPPNMAYLANNYFPKFYTRPDQNYGITIFDQNLATAIQSGELVSGSTTQSLLLNPYGGSVGINGITSPTTALDVSGSLSTRTPGSTGAWYLKDTSANNKFEIGWEATTNALYFYNYGTNSSVLRISGSNVGVNALTPKTSLQVSNPTSGTSVIPTLGSIGSYSSLYITNLNYAYGIIMGAINNGNGYIQAQRTDGTATAYDLQLQPNGGNVVLGGNMSLNGTNIVSNNVSTISTTFTTIGYSQTYGNMFWVYWNDSNGTTDYALVGCIWYPATVNVISSTNNGGHGVTFQMSGNYLQMKTASGTVGPVKTLQIGN
jgi:hypothetical protein